MALTESVLCFVKWRDILCLSLGNDRHQMININLVINLRIKTNRFHLLFYEHTTRRLFFKVVIESLANEHKKIKKIRGVHNLC